MPPITFHGTTRLKFEWGYPDPPEINYRLASLQARLADTQLLAETIAEVAQADMVDRFETETDPSGQPWEELVTPALDQEGILKLTGELRDRATDDEAFVATPRGVFFDSGNLPPYWVYHEQPEGGGRQRLPRRAFVGISAVMRGKIDRLGDRWLEETVRLGQTGKAHAIKAPFGRGFLRLG